MKRLALILLAGAVIGAGDARADAHRSLERFGITWTFDQPLSETGAPGTYHTGRFANGDPWVVGPARIVRIDPASTRDDDGRIRNGSMVNPVPGGRQAYDSHAARGEWRPDLNVAFGVSPEAPLRLDPHSSLVSSISVDAPRHRPQLQTASVLTVLPEAPPPGSFRPPYCGTDKTIRFTINDLNRAALPNLDPVEGAPSPERLAPQFARPWLDHVAGWIGREFHPRANMPDYGRDMANRIGDAALTLLLRHDADDARNHEIKEPLLVRFVQLGIDLFGIVEAGGRQNWQGNGGHATGRKWPILFAGIVLDDEVMRNIGQRSGAYLHAYVDERGHPAPHGPGRTPPAYVHFGEDDQTFYVSQRDIEATVSPQDRRDRQTDQYRPEDLGLPEWAIRPAMDTGRKNRWWGTIYRSVVGPSLPTLALAAHIMEPGQEARTLWNHPALFDYADRWVLQQMQSPRTSPAGYHRNVFSSHFAQRMWERYRDDFPPVWQPADRP